MPLAYCNNIHLINSLIGLVRRFNVTGGAVALGPMVSVLDSVSKVRALAGEIVLCSWARHLTLTVLLSTQVYKWVPANLMLGVALQWPSITSGGVEIFLIALRYRHRR